MMRNIWIDEVRSRHVRSRDDLAVASDVAGQDDGAVAEGRITLAEVRRTLVQRFLGTTPIGYVAEGLRDSELRSTHRVGFTESLY
jgi:hypothetical protein